MKYVQNDCLEKYFLKKYKDLEILGNNNLCILGMPGIALSGKFAVNYIIDDLKAEKIFEISFFDFPPQITIDKGLMILPTAQLFHHYDKDTNRDIFFLTGDFQPLTYYGINLLSEIIIEELKKFNVNLVISLGASAVNNPIPDPEVYISSTSEELLKDLIASFQLRLFSEGIITGMNGLLPGILNKISNMDGVVLLAQACRYLPCDYTSSKKLISVLTKFLKIEINFNELDIKIKELDEEISKLSADKIIFKGSKTKDETNYIG